MLTIFLLIILLSDLIDLHHWWWIYLLEYSSQGHDISHFSSHTAAEMNYQDTRPLIDVGQAIISTWQLLYRRSSEKVYTIFWWLCSSNDLVRSSVISRNDTIAKWYVVTWFHTAKTRASTRHRRNLTHGAESGATHVCIDRCSDLFLSPRQRQNTTRCTSHHHQTTCSCGTWFSTYILINLQALRHWFAKKNTPPKGMASGGKFKINVPVNASK